MCGTFTVEAFPFCGHCSHRCPMLPHLNCYGADCTCLPLARTGTEPKIKYYAEIKAPAKTAEERAEVDRQLVCIFSDAFVHGFLPWSFAQVSMQPSLAKLIPSPRTPLPNRGRGGGGCFGIMVAMLVSSVLGSVVYSTL